MFPPNQTPVIDLERLRFEGSHQVRTYYQSVGPAVVIPGLQSLITGLSVGLLIGAAAWLLGAARPAVWGLLGGLGGLTVTWWLAVRRWVDLVWNLEAVTDQAVSRSAESHVTGPETVRLEVSHQGGRSVQFADIPLSAGKLADLAAGILAGVPFSESQWSGAGALLSRSQFRALRDQFIRRGWAEWINPEFKAQGLTFTHAGRAVMRHLADLPSLPVEVG